MRSNGLLKWLMIPVALGVVLVVVRGCGGGSDTPPSQTTPQLSPEEAKALGVEGDTPGDTVATLVAQVRQLRGELNTALADNKAQLQENERLRQREGAIDRKIDGALQSERDQLRREREQISTERSQTEGLLHDLQQRLKHVGGAAADVDLPVGLGLQPGDALNSNAEGLRWVEPDGKPDAAPGKASGVRARLDPIQRSLADATDTAVARAMPESPRAVITVPTNATLVGSVAMTALLGRIPVDGTVTDAYPFKVLIGAENLAANGIEVPDVAGAVVSGTATGDWTMGCVRGQIRSFTFVFDDGTVRTLPEDPSRGDRIGTDNNRNVNLGWISDPHGIPCVTGTRHSNAQQYLGTQALITAAGAGAAALIDSDTTRMSYVGADGAIGTGITSNEALNRILAGGVQDMSAWVNKLYGQAFAAVYVPPGAPVAIHLDHPLRIDYDPAGRRVDHRLGAIRHAPSLD